VYGGNQVPRNTPLDLIEDPTEKRIAIDDLIRKKYRIGNGIDGARDRIKALKNAGKLTENQQVELTDLECLVSRWDEIECKQS
jgi:hypothetical protein